MQSPYGLTVPHADDTAALVQRIESGASVRTIAAELGVTERTVRNRLRRAEIPLPSERKTAGSTSRRSSPTIGPACRCGPSHTATRSARRG